MNQAQARRWIEAHYGTAQRNEKSKTYPPPEGEIILALGHLPDIRPKTERQKISLELFLYACCNRFGRWFPPSPPSVPKTYRAIFQRCASELQRVERQAMNAPVFVVQSIRDDLYEDFVDVPLPLSPEGVGKLRHLKDRLAAVPIPQLPIKAEEMQQQRAEVEQLIEGLENGTLRSRLRTTLPYALMRRPAKLKMEWQSVALAGNLTSSFAVPADLMLRVASPTVFAPQTTTRWQYGKTLVELEFAGLIDPSIEVPRLQLPTMDVPIDTWPQGVRIAFEVVFQVYWKLHKHEDFIGIWVPAPGDLGDVESWVSIPGRPDINYIRRCHPAMIGLGFVAANDVLEEDLGAATPIAWFMRCRVLAEQYAMLGETREAAFWLNVGTEALLKDRMKRQIGKAGADVDLDKLDGADGYWKDAKALVATKYPELVDEIEWPDPMQKPSLFRQLKYFCRQVPGAPDLRAVQKNYSEVCQRRNTLFHGETEEPSTVDDVTAALQGFDWLADNFCPA